MMLSKFLRYEVGRCLGVAGQKAGLRDHGRAHPLMMCRGAASCLLRAPAGSWTGSLTAGSQDDQPAQHRQGAGCGSADERHGRTHQLIVMVSVSTQVAADVFVPSEPTFRLSMVPAAAALNSATSSQA